MSRLPIASFVQESSPEVETATFPWHRLQRWGIVVAVATVSGALWVAWTIIPAMIPAPTDLHVYAKAAQWFWSGSDPYTLDFEASPLVGVPFQVSQGIPWTNPPTASLIYLPLTFGGPSYWAVVWFAGQFAALVGIVAISFRDLLARLTRKHLRLLVLIALVVAATGLEPVAETIALGQVNVFIALLVLLDVVKSSDHPVIARVRRYLPQGVLVGLAAGVKLVPGLIVLWWLVTRQFRAAAWATGTMVALWGASFIVSPGVTWRFLGDGVALEGVRRLGSHALFVGNQSIYANVGRWMEVSATPGWAWIPLAGLAVGAGVAGGVMAYRHGQMVAAAVLVMMPGLLAAPIAWTHHAVWLVPAFAVILGDGRDPRRVFMLAMSAPLWFMHTRSGVNSELIERGFTFYFFLLYVVVFAFVWWCAMRDGERTSGSSPESLERTLR